MSSELVPGVIHLRCANPGPMTLTGTNTYVVRDADRVAVIDPGPTYAGDAASHLDATVTAAAQVAATISPRPESVPMFVALTHHHEDHEGGVDALVGRLRTGGHEVVVHGGSYGWDDAVPEALHKISAPGHTADSVAFYLEAADGHPAVLFSGDTLLGGSSSFVAHPDGNLTDYLASLATLEELTRGQHVLLAPGHGELGADAHGVIKEYLNHRADRLREVRSALEKLGADAGVSEVADEVYGDIDTRLRPAVEAIVSAQLEHLRR